MTTSDQRKDQAYDVRVEAAELARSRGSKPRTPNGEELLYKDRKYLASFTKGLPHDRETGLLSDPDSFLKFVRGIESGQPDVIDDIPLGPQCATPEERFCSGISRGDESTPIADVRAWESMAAGNAFDLQGPDSNSLAMPPCPTLDSDELVTEMTELYWMALLRDVPFHQFADNELVAKAVKSINATKWISGSWYRSELLEDERRRVRGPYTPETAFRGLTKGEDVGPYISQFLLAGSSGLGGASSPEDGYIRYGAIRIDQRVRVATPQKDYMTSWEAFLDVQNGADLRGRETYESNPEYRFITTPRDLATYVHIDALYQAYLNACILLLSIKAPLDKGIPFTGDDDVDKQQGFVLFGGPHILSLVTEVAIRSLKAIRYQKYNTHRRLRPEAVGGLIERYAKDDQNPLFAPVQNLVKSMDPELLELIKKENCRQNREVTDYGRPRTDDYDPCGTTGETLLLPMAFPEGSPMHPSYGAGHAVVAGAGVTMLKAFFNHSWELPFAFEATSDGFSLKPISQKLGLEGELNKLCSNISIGRDWAGVHYFTDYIESIRLGEEVAIGLLEEQMLTFKEDFSMTLPRFDGSIYEIKTPDRR